MLSTKPNQLSIPSELNAEMTPVVRAFVESLLDRIAAVGEYPDILRQYPPCPHPRPLSQRERGVFQDTHLKTARPLPSEGWKGPRVVLHRQRNAARRFNKPAGLLRLVEGVVPQGGFEVGVEIARRRVVLPAGAVSHRAGRLDAGRGHRH